MVGTAEGFTVQVEGEQGLELRLPCQEGIDPCAIPSFDVRDLASDPGGNGIWVATASGVAHRDTVGLGTWTNYAAGPGLPGATRLIRHRGEWIAAFSDGVRVLRGVEPQLVWELFADGMAASAGIVDLLSDGEALVAAGSKGVWISQGGGSWTLLGGRAIPVRAVLRTPDGNTWAAGTDAAEVLDGLWKYDGSEWERKVFEGPSIRSHYLAIAFDPRRHAACDDSTRGDDPDASDLRRDDVGRAPQHGLLDVGLRLRIGPGVLARAVLLLGRGV